MAIADLASKYLEGGKNVIKNFLLHLPNGSIFNLVVIVTKS